MFLRILISVLFLFVLFSSIAEAKPPQSIAQELGAFLNESTFLVACIDVSNVEPKKLTDRSVEYLRRSLELFQFDDVSKKKTVDEAQNIINDWAKEMCSLFSKNELKTCYCIGSIENPDFPFIFIVSLAGKNEEEKKAIRKELYEDDPRFVLIEHAGFQVAAKITDEYNDDNDTSEQKANLKVYLDSFKPKELPLTEILALRENDPFQFVFFFPKKLNITKMFGNLAVEEDIPEQIFNALQYISGKMKWAVIGIDPIQPELKIIVQANSGSAARQIVASLEGLIDFAITSMKAFASLPALTNTNEPHLRAVTDDVIPLFLEICRGSLRMFLPNRENDRLTWTYGTSPEKLTPEQAAVGGTLIFLGVVIANIDDFTKNEDEENEKDE